MRESDGRCGISGTESFVGTGRFATNAKYDFGSSIIDIGTAHRSQSRDGADFDSRKSMIVASTSAVLSQPAHVKRAFTLFTTAFPANSTSLFSIATIAGEHETSSTLM